jgi:hypothetical protein
MKHRLPIILLSLLSAASLGTAAYLWNTQRSLTAENAALRARFVSIETSTPAPPPKLAATATPDAQDVPPAPGEADRPPAPTAEEAARRKEFETRMTALREKESLTRRQAKISLLKSRLNLSPEQEQMATDALQKANDLRQSLRNGFTPGQAPDFAKMQQAFKSDAVAAAEIREQLSPEQQVEFDRVREEERADRAEEQTNRQLSEWQQYLKMSPEQKDTVFQALSEMALTNDPETQPDAKDFEEVQQRMEASQKLQREALAQILDETQMAVYDDLNTSRRETFGDFGGMGGPGGRGGRAFGGPPSGR